LNVYSPKTDHFDQPAVEAGAIFAGYAAVAIGNAHLYDDAATQARQMREAMIHRAVIEQAKGIIIGERRCTPAEAFEILRALSNTTNRRLHAVAEALVAQATSTSQG
jgi:AmiR/NasT family two-component response regulator